MNNLTGKASTIKKVQRTREGYRQLAQQAYKLKNSWEHRSPYGIVSSAEQNADDTMLDEGFKSWHESDDSSERWVSYFFSTLEFLLTERDVTTKTRQWFERRGIAG